MTLDGYGTGIGLLVGWGVVAVLAGRSMWLVSRKYLVALQLANAANAALMMIRVARHDAHKGQAVKTGGCRSGRGGTG